VATVATLRVAVGTPDPELAARVSGIVAGAGHEVAFEGHSSFDLLEACFAGEADLAVVDQSLPRVPGAEVAAVLGGLSRPIPAVVLHRGELGAADDLLVLDPTRPGFETALANVLANAAHSRGSGGRRTG